MAVRLDMEIVVDDKGAVTIIERVGDAARKTHDKLKNAGEAGDKAFTGLATKMAGTYLSIEAAQRAAAALFSTMEGGFKDAIQDERRMLALNNQLKVMGLETGSSSDELDRFAASFRAAGVEEEASLGGLQRMLPVTRDLAVSMGAVSTAVGLAKGENRDFAESLGMISALMVGSERGLLPAIKDYGVKVDYAASKTEQMQQALDQLWGRGAAGQGIVDHLQQVEALRISYGEFWKTIADHVLVALGDEAGYLDTARIELDEAAKAAGRFVDVYANGHTALDVVPGMINAITESSKSLFQALTSADAEKALKTAQNLIIGNVAPPVDAARAALEQYSTLLETSITPQEKYAKNLEKMTDWYMKGYISQAQFAAGLKAITPVITKAAKETEPILLMQGFFDKLIGEKDELAELADSVQKIFSGAMKPPVGEIPLISPTMANGQPVPPPPPDFEPTLAAQRFFIDVWNKNSEQLVADTQRTMDALGFSLASTLAGFLGQWQQHDGDTRARVADTFAFIGAMSGNIASQMNKNDKKQFEAAKDLRKMQVLMSVATGIMSIWEHWGYLPYVAGALTALVVAEGVMQMGVINSQQFKGQAHSGLDYVPSTGTYLLEQGEAVIPRYRNVPGYSGGGRPVTIAIDASGAWFDSDERVNQMATKVHEAVSRGLAVVD